MLKRWKRKPDGGHLDGSRPLDLGKTQVPTASPLPAILVSASGEDPSTKLKTLAEENINPVSILIEILSRTLGEYDVIVSKASLKEVVANWIRGMKDEPPESRQFTADRIKNDPSAVAMELAEKVLFSIAEERPGTDPFSHEPTIPTPVVVILNASYALASCADIAIINGAYQTARGYIDCLGQLAYISADSAMNFPAEEDQVVQVVTPDTESGTAIFEEAIILTPQPALAFCARKMESVADRLESGEWIVGSEKGDEDASITIKNLRRAATIFRDLNSQYGRHGDAALDS
jgi:hypothetical protein